ncbi:hypothetical protein PHYBLDRAFT_61877 [Phycomyces blakesleeanus NRRL 1555(-)]|uniref:Tc1-like transposase DDE domain-containing protein n=1 Tax=Phycomyces blakesleeanus (strain ATCC 8743b / DSM 1359 / FGSC 10004 / NBRC 33097 / NRRL 1555) TaxID=763407 RepID=A0A163BDC2_PHYB8|nr:hypothetical protein PHYBLDRAFT_61877 [Phycomyces blakesleeanus NRRL 1555(-)]OAD80821.1 hypothetical protein PHYBLDRAFT_61877 [Phycomyces blakesleeanus NRRL 1555(-)]|eukprot:XP_018298861.1 hypothetical protein PHYBLDRAFT_61877 [Phycomyces blakesleeanus NRRL 1555(-)]
MRSNGVSYITNSIFVDEAEFKVHLIRRAGSTKRSEKSTVKSLAKRGLGITILAAVAYQGVEKFQAKMVHGGTPESVFIEFVKTIMDSLDQDNADPHNFIINNVSRNKFPLVTLVIKHICRIPDINSNVRGSGETWKRWYSFD